MYPAVREEYELRVIGNEDDEDELACVKLSLKELLPDACRMITVAVWSNMQGGLKIGTNFVYALTSPNL